MKQGHLNLLLLAIAAGLFALLVIDENREEAKIAKAIERQPPLTALDANAVRSIRLKNPGSADIVLEKTSSGWQLREPVAIAADLVQVGNLTALATLETRGSVDAAIAKRADLGLDPPRSTVLLDDTVLAIGEIEPLKRSRYVELDPGQPGHRISLVDDFAPDAFDGEFTDLVNKAMLPFDAEITRLDLPGLSLVREAADGPWTASPASTAATPEAIRQLVEAWHEVRAIATVPPVTADKARIKPDVTITLGDGQTIRYAIADIAGSRFLQRLDVPVSYQLAPVEADRLLKLLPTTTGAPPASAAPAQVP